MSAVADPVPRFVAAAEAFGVLVDEIGPDDWRRETPCDDWDVAALVDHVSDEMRWALPLLSGMDLEEAAATLENHPRTGDPVSDWKVSASLALAAAIAADPASSVHTSAGEISAERLLSELFTDVLIHTWDLAAGLGRAATLPEDQVAACAAFFATVEDEWRSAGAIGPRLPVAEDASDQTRLLAAFGRAG